MSSWGKQDIESNGSKTETKGKAPLYQVGYYTSIIQSTLPSPLINGKESQN